MVVSGLGSYAYGFEFEPRGSDGTRRNGRTVSIQSAGLIHPRPGLRWLRSIGLGSSGTGNWGRPTRRPDHCSATTIEFCGLPGWYRTEQGKPARTWFTSTTPGMSVMSWEHS